MSKRKISKQEVETHTHLKPEIDKNPFHNPIIRLQKGV